MVVTPSHALLSDLRDDIVRELWTKSEMMHLVGECVFCSATSSEIVFQVMHMHVAIAERLARGEMEVAHDLVDANTSLNAASFPALLVQVFRVVFPIALFYILATAERPGDAGISVADFSASVAAPCLLGVRG